MSNKQFGIRRRAGLLIVAVVLGLVGGLGTFGAEGETVQPVIVYGFDQPLQFFYGEWNKDVVKAEKGNLVLNDIPAGGGGGVNGSWDFSAHADKSPALRLRIRPGNTCTGMLIMFNDADGRSALYEFALPSPSEEFAFVLPKGSAALATPNTLEYKKDPGNPGVLDMAKLRQFHLAGNWQKGELKAEVDAIVLVSPDAKMLAERQAMAKKQAEEAVAAAKRAAEEKEQLAKKRQNMIWTYQQCRETGPMIVQTSLAAPDIISIVIEAQKIIPAKVVKYEAKPGDEKIEEKWADGGANNGVRRAKLMRGGTFVGMLQGMQLEYLTIGEQLEGDPFLDFVSEAPDNYTVTSKDDPAFAAGVKPVAVYRKTLPINLCVPYGSLPTRHRLYLKMPAKISAGKTYEVATAIINPKNPNPRFTADFAQLPSESVHVNQNGYRPDDPFKRATLSVWLGTGGAYRFPEAMTFSLIDQATRKPVFSGKVERVMDVDGTEQLGPNPAKNHARTAVYKMDFGTFSTPGTYRVCVDGVGCSYPFEISDKVWEKAFLTQMKGLYNNRSGIEIGPPYSDFKKPRDLHPDDGTVITRSTFDVQEKGVYRMNELPKTDTHEAVKNAWGGYHDAGDWNPRKVNHMITTLVQLELVELIPDYFNKLNLNIPPTPGIPDIITEALFEIDCFRRMQRPDGGIPYGIESQYDPENGEISYLTTQHLYVLEPTIHDSWLYAAVAGRAAKVLRPIKPELAKVYEDSAVRAFEWAEADYAKKVTANALGSLQELWQAVDARNMSALVLYEITGDKKYHDVFMATTCLKNPGQDLCSWGTHIQTDAAFLYARLDDAKADPQIKKNAIAAVIKLADFSMAYAAGNAFNITCREKGRPMFAGFFSVSGGMEVARAHFLTGKKEYLAGAVQSCQFGLGCNPGNIVYTTGLGSNAVKNPLHTDARSTGQPAPLGITVFGNADIWTFRGSFWDINLNFVNKPENIWPNAYDWPLPETYFDVPILVSTAEFTIELWQQNVFVWGYLAGRSSIGK